MRPSRPPGVIDTLSAGFTSITRQLWILTLPVALDLAFWWGPRLSPLPVLNRSLSSLEIAPEFHTQISQVTESMNLFHLLVAGVLGVPSLLTGQSPVPPLGPASVIEISDEAALVASVALLTLVGLFVGCLYLVPIAARIQGKQVEMADLARRIALTWTRGLVLTSLLLAAGLFIGFPLFLALAGLGSASPAIGSLVTSFAFILVLWAWFYLFFTVDAILISQVGPVHAFRRSFNLVRLNFLQALGFIALVTLIGLGLPFVWLAYVDNPWWLAAGIIGNAYVGAGLVSASLIFYRDRQATETGSRETVT
ncbi:MAG: hypothetical protein ACE5NC_06215 [Anaerolineae bacterium]